MSQTVYKESGGAKNFAPETKDTSGLYPAQPETKAASRLCPPHESALFNPAPKAALLGLALLLMWGYASFIIGFPGPAAPLPPAAQTVPPAAQTQPAATQTQPAAAQTQPAAAQTQPAPPALADDEAAARTQREKIARLGRTPRLMSAQTYADENLDGLSLQNSSLSQTVFRNSSLQNSNFYKMRFVECAFTGTDLSKADIREASFENCTFEDTSFDEATLTGVNFSNCAFISTGREQGFSKTRLALARLYDVTFEQARLEDFELFNVSGRVTFRASDLSGLRASLNGSDRHFPTLAAAATQFRLNLENCSGGDFNIHLHQTPAELKIEGSDLDNVTLYSFNKIDIRDSRVTGQGFIEAGEWLAVRNSTLCADLKAYGPMYLLNNSYISQRAASSVNALLKDGDAMQRATSLRPAGGAPCYVMGGADEAWLNTYGGKIHISDLKIRFGYFELDNSREPTALNLKNVTLDRAHIYNSELDDAYWEKVTVLNPITSRNVRTQKPLVIQAAGVDLPAGKPWIDSAGYSLEETSARAWPQPEIPELK